MFGKCQWMSVCAIFLHGTQSHRFTTYTLPHQKSFCLPLTDTCHRATKCCLWTSIPKFASDIMGQRNKIVGITFVAAFVSSVSISVIPTDIFIWHTGITHFQEARNTSWLSGSKYFHAFVFCLEDATISVKSVSHSGSRLEFYSWRLSMPCCPTSVTWYLYASVFSFRRRAY